MSKLLTEEEIKQYQRQRFAFKALFGDMATMPRAADDLAHTALAALRAVDTALSSMDNCCQSEDRSHCMDGKAGCVLCYVQQAERELAGEDDEIIRRDAIIQATLQQQKGCFEDKGIMTAVQASADITRECLELRRKVSCLERDNAYLREQVRLTSGHA